MDVVDLVARTKLVDYVVDHMQILAHQLLLGDLFLFAEVNQLSIEPIARGTKLVLADQCTSVNAITLVRRVELPQHRRGRLDQRCDGKRLVQSHWNVAHPHFQRLEEWMWPNV